MDSDDVIKFVVTGIVILVGFLICLFLFAAVVPAGSVGVKDTFGDVDPVPFQPGIHLKNPFTRVVIMTTQTQKYIDYGTSDVATVDALSNEGLAVSMGIAVNYHIDPMMAPEIYKNIGVEYQTVVMLHPIHAVPRDIISRYDVKTLYSAQRDPSSPDRAKIEGELFDGIKAGLLLNGKERGIVIEKVFIRNIQLPQLLTDAITNKLKMEQEITQKKFEVQKQEAEADRMRAEAQGIADYNKLIAQSLTDPYLRWYFVKMLETRQGDTYYVPIGSDGLPLMKVIP
jgi:regulator of protease activity HflC (stomatin/prohibitin superfamily)